MGELILGTAQFGDAYGISNKRGKIPFDESLDILRIAADNGISTLDTAQAYGDSECVIGRYHAQHDNQFRVISKVGASGERGTSEVRNLVENSLERMNVGALHGCLIHGYRGFTEDPAVWRLLEEEKSDGRIRKIGFSLYYPTELESILEGELDVDIVQVPYSIFDQRFARFFPKLHEMNIEVHVRSVFLQGIVFMSPHELGDHFSEFRPKLKRFHDFALQQDVPIAHTCLNYALSHEAVDAVLVGVDGIGNLQQILQWHHYSDRVNLLREKLSSFEEMDESIVVPTMWNKS